MAEQQCRPKPVAAATFYDLDSLKRHQPEQSTSTASNKRSRQRAADAPVRFNPLNAPYASFKTQAAAFEFLDKQACSRILRTFACETAATGQREFIVTSAECFWQHYVALTPGSRHHYEIVRQGQPCNLYFDLEFCPECNPGVNGPLLVELLLSGVQELLYELFGVPWDPSWVLELDSSTPSKFSRHLIIQLPRLAFADACHAGRFARCVLLRLLAKGMHSSNYADLLVANKEGGVTSFVDMGVYTRNRAFRLYLSSKYGKAAVLRLTHRFGGASRCPKTAFHDALVSVLHHKSAQQTPSTTTAAAERGDPACARSTGDSSGSSMRHRLSLLYMSEDGQDELLQLPVAWQQLPMLQLRPLEHIRPRQQQLSLPPAAAAAAAAHSYDSHTLHSNLQQPRAAGVLLEGPLQPCFGPSPFPLLDGFINQVCCEGGVQGQVRSWLVQPGSSTIMVFNIKGNRWCANVERHHASNGIFFCVDLSAGVYYQKCYDPECRHFRSNCMPLPKDVWQACMPAPAPTHHQQQHQQQSQQQAMHHHAPRQHQQQQQWQPHAPLQAQGLACSLQACNQQPRAQPYQQQQQQCGPDRFSAAAPCDSEDDECLRLLLELETQQGQQQGRQQQGWQQQGQQQQAQVHECGRAHQEQRQQLQRQAGSAIKQPAECGAAAEAGDIPPDEDEWCLQLLQSVEQHRVQAMQA